MHFRDIPQLYRANYSVTIPWSYIETWLSNMSSDYVVEIEPDFQRDHVWTDDKRTAYVEYILAGGPSSREIQWNCYGWDESINPGPVILVDGLQRLTAVRKFMRNELLAYGLLFSQYDGKMSFSSNYLTFFVNNLPNRCEVLRWYLQLNRGGVVHSQEELDRVSGLLEKEVHGVNR